MGIDLSTVDWTFVGLMTALSFITALLGGLIAYRNRFAGAIIAAILFAIGFVAWNYWPHAFGLPILKSTGPDATVVPAAAVPATPPAPVTAPVTPAPAPAAPPPATPAAPVSPAPATPAPNSNQ